MCIFHRICCFWCTEFLTRCCTFREFRCNLHPCLETSINRLLLGSIKYKQNFCKMSTGNAWFIARWHCLRFITDTWTCAILSRQITCWLSQILSQYSTWNYIFSQSRFVRLIRFAPNFQPYSSIYSKVCKHKRENQTALN